MSAVSILTLWQLVNGHNWHHSQDKHLFYLCYSLNDKEQKILNTKKDHSTTKCSRSIETHH